MGLGPTGLVVSLLPRYNTDMKGRDPLAGRPSPWRPEGSGLGKGRSLVYEQSARHLTKAALCAASTAALAWVAFPVPFSTVPVSGQTIGVMTAGILLPPRWAALSMVVYLGLGIVGLPVFAGGGAGLGVLAGPTGGYIWAFVPSASFVSWGLRRPWAQGRGAAAAVLVFGGVVLVYVPGVLQMISYTGLTWAQGFAAGALPFLVGDALKVLFCWWLAGHPGVRVWRDQ